MTIRRSCDIIKKYSEHTEYIKAANRRTDTIMAIKSKNKNTNNGRNNPREKTKDQATQTPLQKRLKTPKW